MLPRSNLKKAIGGMITERNSRESPLLRLPGEIRNDIYRYVLSGMYPRLAGSYSRHHLDVHTSRHHLGVHASRQIDLAVIAVCRQTYQEAHTLPFSLNTWILSSLEYLTIANLSRFRDFQIREVRNVHIQYVIGFTAEKDGHLKHFQDRGVLLCDLLPGIRELYLVHHDVTFVPMISNGLLHLWKIEKLEQRKALENLKAWLLQGSDGKLRIKSNFVDPPNGADDD